MHQPHFFGPALEGLETFQQLVGDIGNLEEPLGQLAPFNRRARAPALAVNHLLIGQHGVVHGIPVHGRLAAFDDACLKKVEEQGLLVLVVISVAGGEFPLPVEGQAHHLQLPAHGGNVVVGPALGVHAFFHGGVFGGHAEGVPAHRVQYGVSARTLVPRDHITHRVVPHMAHVDAA